ncbi:lytic polysaccharide monooxygenase auxiliary activity family 9 protein [Glycomyces salinus]|uniref:lytic polysaccharide monooxygenase auxiliary activity family 9 protein n=1 Tax=Glycomyces salinus TaxID=980294 RepID=UPI0018EB18D0|nr:lytic polysaccharide monooxygenase [Glycomyces salinus]
MRRSRKIALALSGAGALAIAATATAIAWGHGYAADPPSRSALCADGAVSDCGAISYEPQSVEGPQGFPEAGPADGEICAGGNQRFAELDDPRGGQWPATEVSGGDRTFSWTMTAPHSTASFEYYITTDGWDPAQPLTRAALEAEPFFVDHMHGAQPDHEMSHSVPLPDRSGRHLILGVWTIADTTNAFYSCMDVDFGGGGGGPEPTEEPSDTPSEEPSDAPTDEPEGCEAAAWDSSATYVAGDAVTHGGTAYTAKWWTRAEEPGTTGVWGVWEAAGSC